MKDRFKGWTEREKMFCLMIEDNAAERFIFAERMRDALRDDDIEQIKLLAQHDVNQAIPPRSSFGNPEAAKNFYRQMHRAVRRYFDKHPKSLIKLNPPRRFRKAAQR